MRKKILLGLCLILLPMSLWAITNSDLDSTSYMLDVDSLFPTPGHATSDNGVDNIADFVTNLTPLLTTLMAIGATLMVIFGGFRMVIGGSDSEQTEQGKTILKDALTGLVIGLLAYVIIMTVGNILGV